MQSEDIQLEMSAAESHWQLGRVEAHGRTVKRMLDLMNGERPIRTSDDFSRALCQVFFVQRMQCHESMVSLQSKPFWALHAGGLRQSRQEQKLPAMLWPQARVLKEVNLKKHDVFAPLLVKPLLNQIVVGVLGEHF